MIDIHTHILHCVDDGSPSIKDSIDMLLEEVEQGVTDVIFTPHLRGKYCVSREETEKFFLQLQNEIAKREIPINVYLGQEILVTDDLVEQLKSGKAWTMSDSKFLLLEFGYHEEKDIAEVVYELNRLGYKSIVAHFERYEYASVEDAYAVKEVGGLIQVNADSIVGSGKKAYKKRVKALFNECLVDFVASDVHVNRENCLRKAKEFVRKKYGMAAESIVFRQNAKRIIEKQKG